MAVDIRLNHIAAALALLASGSALAHGYISKPESRNYLCSIGGNSQCGGVQWEPQSVEGPSGFPQFGPQDGQIASAGSVRWSELNVQTSDRWTKREVQAGPFAISWTFTANHVTRNWRYYLTKQDWNPNQPLARDAFELTPFCVVEGNMVQPPKQVTHQCNLPERTGYQVILGVWEVGDTSNSFYNLIDAQFKGGVLPPVEWSQGGTIYPSMNLDVGDKAMTRVFDANGERRDLQTVLTIASQEQGQKDNWSHALASKINAEQSQLRAGQQGADGKFNPVYGQNPVYLKAGSKLERVEIQLEQQQPPVVDTISVSGLAGDYTLDNGNVTLDFSVAAQGDLTVTNTVYDHGGVAKGQSSADIKDSSHSFTMPLEGLKAGHHQLVIKATPKAGGETIQQTLDMMFKDKEEGGGEGSSCNTTDPEAANVPAWQTGKVYNGGDKVSHSQLVWRAKYWTQNNEPSRTADQWSLESQVQLGWNAVVVYNGGDLTNHNGRQWKAKWWSQGNEPGKHDVWADVGAASCD